MSPSKIITAYVFYVDKVSTKVGRLAMYAIFIMIATLLLGAVTRNIINLPLSWTVEMAQFTITAYYILGGAYSMQQGAHVRMDLLYSRFTERTKARWDAVTSFCLVGYLVCLLVGSISSTMYAIEYGQRKFSQWNPSLIPIKVIMVVGIILMLLQAIAILFKDIEKSRSTNIITGKHHEL